jgi:hypothetical protein
MKDPRLLFFCALLLFGVNGISWSQTTIPDCDDIQVEVKAINPSNGLANGSIELTFSKPLNGYRIFLLNAGPDKTQKEELEHGKVTRLDAGFFDFLIMDRNKKGCIRQLTVTLKY